MKDTKLTITWEWKCTKCKSTQTSTSAIRHQMDYCKCGYSAVDLEEYYSRCTGEVEVLNIKTKID